MESFTILAVEDNPDHATLIELALHGGLTGCDVHVVSSGADAQKYLTSTLSEGAPVLGLIILDMWLGDTTGLRVLEWISQRVQFEHIPVIMFTTSADPELARRAYALGARRFVLKPPDFRDLVKVVKEVLPVWTRDYEPSDGPTRLGEGKKEVG